MIQKIGVIYQDRNSFGFLDGLRRRLGCAAELIRPPAAIGNTRVLPRKQARLAWDHFQKKGVELVVRLTDADNEPWQEVRRKEQNNIPKNATSVWIFGVAVNNVEDWLCLDQEYIARELSVSLTEVAIRANRTGLIKSAIAAKAQTVNSSSFEVVGQFVAEAPPNSFRRWLQNDEALQVFYSDCRAAATRANCETPNELDNSANE